MEPRRPGAGRGALPRRLEVFLYVTTSAIFFRMLGYLPSAQDMTWVGKRFGCSDRSSTTRATCGER